MRSDASWGAVPPLSPDFGRTWIDTSVSVVSPIVRTFDGSNYVRLGVLDTLALALNADPSARVIDTDHGYVPLADYDEAVVVLSGDNAVGDFGRAPSNAIRALVCAGRPFLYGFDAPRQAAIAASLADTIVLVSNGQDGWRLWSWQSGWRAGDELSKHVLWSGLGAVAGLTLPQTRFSYGSNLAAVAGAARLGIGAFGGKYQIAVPALPGWGYLAANAAVSH